jgi:hypothetical protein
MKKWKVILLHDIEDEDCSGDYCGVEIYQDKNLIQTYGDYYHDKGYEKMEGFFDALSWIQGQEVKPEIKGEACFDMATCQRKT